MLHDKCNEKAHLFKWATNYIRRFRIPKSKVLIDPSAKPSCVPSATAFLRPSNAADIFISTNQ